MILPGLIGLASAVWAWARLDFGDLAVEPMMRVIIPSMLLGIVGLQFMFTCFLVELLSRPAGPRKP
jgi:hypothetical protein